MNITQLLLRCELCGISDQVMQPLRFLCTGTEHTVVCLHE